MAKQVKSVNLVDAFYAEIESMLTTGNVKSNMPISNWVKRGVNNMLTKGKPDVVMSNFKQMVIDTQQHIDSRTEIDKDYTEYLISRKLIPWQRDYFTDGSKRIAVQAGRRSGKTYANALKAVSHCLDGYDTIGSVRKVRKVIIIGLTKEKTAEQYWNLIKDIIKECRISTTQINSSEYVVKFSNGSSIRLSGNASKAEREKLRGDEYSLIIIDEAQSQQGLRYMLESIFEPIAYARDSQIILSGTGAIIKGSVWQEITDGNLARMWRHYHCTMRDNPTIANCESVLMQVLVDKGWKEDDCEYIREYLGENCYDSTRTVISNYKIYEEDELKAKNPIFEQCIIGLDYGFTDYNSFVPVLVDNQGLRWVRNVFKKNRMSASEIVAKANEYSEWAKSLKIPKVMFIADINDQSVSQDIWRSGINIVNAYKVDERLQWAKLKERLSTGEMILPQDCVLIDECARTVWKYDEDRKQVIGEIDDDIYHPEALDALKYVNYYLDTNKCSRGNFN